MYKYFTILKSALLDIRNEWTWYLLLMIANPLATLLFLTIVAGKAINFSGYIVGTIVMTFGTGIFLSLGQTFALYKETSSLDYYLALPLPKGLIMMSLILRNVLLSLPSMIIILIIGSFVYSVNISIGFPFILAILLTSISLAGIGTMIGVYAKNIQVASIATQVLTPILIYLAPVFITMDALPRPLQLIAYLLPTTYSANALRAAMEHNVLSIDFLVLGLLGFVSIFLSTYVMDWRQE
jgi:ABC-2 type transport system permease protein